MFVKFVKVYMSELDEIRPSQHNGTANLIPKKQGDSSTVDYINPNNRNCMIAVPKYHENLYSQLKKYEQWLQETQGDPHIGRHYNKRIRTPEDLKKLENLIMDLRTAKSELFIDYTFHRKPKQLPLREYINEFLRVKGVFNYYTFTSWYRVTVYNESGDPDLQTQEIIIDKEGNERKEYPKKEYLIIPLLIRLKKNKVYDQFKSVHYTNASGTEYEVKPVNPAHFLRDDDVNSRDKEAKNKIKYEDNYVSKIANYDRIEVLDEENDD